MADVNTNVQQPPEPDPDLKSLGDRLVGTWELSGGTQGRVTFEWMEGGFFLIQRVDLEQHGQRIKGIEIIGHERQFGAEPSEEIKSRFYSNTGDTLDYVYELEGDTLTIWGGEKGSPAYYRGAFSDDGDTLSGAWHYPGVAVTRRPRPGSSRRGSDGRRYSYGQAGDGGFTNSGTAVLAATAPFLVLLAALHFIKPEVDPSWRVISENAIGDYGWMMVLAFPSLALGC